MGRTHVLLTEPSVSAPVVTHEGKGREGKGIGSGREIRSASTTSWRSLGNARAARLGMMSEAETIHEPLSGLATIEGINLDADVPCDSYSDHLGSGCEYGLPADYIVESTCDLCGERTRYPCCRPCLSDIWAGEGECDRCLIDLEPDATRIVEVLR